MFFGRCLLVAGGESFADDGSFATGGWWLIGGLVVTAGSGTILASFNRQSTTVELGHVSRVPQ